MKKLDVTAMQEHLNDENAHAALFDEKVDKVPGKQLSTEDYTTEDKNTLESLNASFGTKEDKINKISTIIGNETNETLYPNAKAVYDSDVYMLEFGKAYAEGLILPIQNQIDGINTLLASDNINLDTIQEIVDAIENVESYLATILVNDLTTGGVTKALTAEMGKKLDQIKLTATIATDEETQIAAAVTEDNKVVSRSKLFNWWEWAKTKAITLTNSLTMRGYNISLLT